MNKDYRYAFLIIVLSIGAVWLRSSIGKIAGGKFVSTFSSTASKLASNNPNIWYKDFLHNSIITNPTFFGNLIMWGEFLTSIAITLPSLYLLFNKEKKTIQIILFLGLLGGGFLNLNFWLAAGWTGSSTESLNILMLIIEAIGLVVLLRTLRK